jgi:hypothetical protein
MQSDSDEGSSPLPVSSHTTASSNTKAPRQIILNAPRAASDDDLTPEPSDNGIDDADGEEELDMDSVRIIE